MNNIIQLIGQKVKREIEKSVINVLEKENIMYKEIMIKEV